MGSMSLLSLLLDMESPCYISCYFSAKNRNIVIVVSPFNSIIENQKNVLLERGIKVETLTCEKKERQEKLLQHLDSNVDHEDSAEKNCAEGDIVLFAW